MAVQHNNIHQAYPQVNTKEENNFLIDINFSFKMKLLPCLGLNVAPDTAIVIASSASKAKIKSAHH